MIVLLIWALVIFIVTDNIPATLFLMIVLTPFELLSLLIVGYLKALLGTHR